MTTSRDSQIAAFLDRQPYTPVNESPDDPQVIFTGALQLDRQQEENLVLAAKTYREQMQEELAGKDDTADLESESVPAQESLDVEGMTWFQERNLWDLVYRQRMGWRRLVWQGIYAAGSNIHFPLTRRTVQQMISRAQNYFFQTEPWFAATPVGMDSEPAKAANDWTQYKFEAAKLRPTLEKAIELAFIRGECVLRVASEDTFSHYEAFESVAVNPETGEPMMWGDESAPEYIFQDDEFAPAPDGSIIHVASGIPFQEPPTEWATVKVKRKIQSYSGPRAQIVAYRDFLAPRTAESLDKADCCCYDYELPAIEIVEQYIARVQRQGGFDEAEYPRVMQYLRDSQGSPMAGRTAANRPRADLGESQGTEMSTRGDPLVRVAEFTLHIDANNDGVREDVYLLLDLDTNRPILYDYVQNVFQDRRRPWRVVRINPIDGRWYGQSAVAVFWQLQKIVDLTINRWDLSNSQSGTVTFWDPTKTSEGQANPNLKLNCGQTYRKLNPQTKAADIVERVNLYEFKGTQLEPFLQLHMQLFANLSGVANANDTQAAGLETAKLATGIRNIDRSGQEQFAPLLSHLSEGITDVCETALVISILGADEEETYEITGEQGQRQIAVLKMADVRRMKWGVELQLTRYRAEQEEQQGQAATTVALEYYLQVPPQIQPFLAPLYRQRLKSYGVRDVDKIIQVATMTAGGEAAQGPAPTGTTPSLTAIP